MLTNTNPTNRIKASKLPNIRPADESAPIRARATKANTPQTARSTVDSTSVQAR
ncbi:hypothetical protein D3C72_2473920 [compost metagenome]